MGFLGRRAERRRTEHDNDLDALATVIATDFVTQYVASVTADYLVRAITRGEKTAAALVDEIQWDGIDEKERKRLDELARQLKAERQANPGCLTLFVSMPKGEIGSEDFRRLGERIRKHLEPSHIQSVTVAMRGETAWFIGVFYCSINSHEAPAGSPLLSSSLCR